MQRWRKITDGERTKFVSEDPLPWQVGLMTNILKNHRIFCGAVLLSNEVMLSAAHCKREMTFDGSDLAYIGSKLEQKSITIDDMHRIQAKHLVHPLYEEFKAKTLSIAIHDLMLLFLVTPLKDLCSSRPFARLPAPGDFKHFLAGKNLLVSGWGTTIPVTREQVIAFFGGIPFKVDTPGHVRFINTFYLPPHICQKRLQNFFNSYQNVEGAPTDPNIQKIRVGDINFNSHTGSSMMCTSACVAEDVSQCVNCQNCNLKKDHCAGDSGGI